MTQEEFLIDTLEYYSVDPTRRCATIDGKCYYSPKNTITTGDGCAIGRHLPDMLKESLDVASHGNPITVYSLFTNVDHSHFLKDVPDILKSLDVEFLFRIQVLHDYNSNWHTEGLTNTGKEELRRTIIEFNLDENKFQKYIN